MNLLPKSHKEFAEKTYWDRFFSQKSGKSFEWYGEYLDLINPLHKYVKKNDKILMLGCGTSRLGMQLYDAGFKEVISIDRSAVAIKQMQELNAKIRPNLQFIELDATDMSSQFQDEHFSVAIDKGTLDALFVDTSSSVQETVTKYFQEIERVLRIGGRYLCISLLQKHILDFMIDYFPKHSFLMRIVYCQDAEVALKEKLFEATRNRETMVMPVFMLVATKFKALVSPVLEICFTVEKAERLQTGDELKNAVKSLQQAAMICCGMTRHSITGHEEIVLDICAPTDGAVRYTGYVLENSNEKKTYACLIVPKGRESEWLFSKKEGRKKLVELVNYRRLLVVALNPEQEYTSIEAIKEELAETVKNLAPAYMDGQYIPFISLKSEEERTETLVKGTSEISGDYIVEEITSEDGKILRRIIFMNNPRVIQSEALITTEKLKGKKPRKTINFGYLACKHHLYMSVGVQMSLNLIKASNPPNKNPQNRILVIGLGGGSLCTFLQKAIPSLNIVAVEIDPTMLEIAEQYFELKVNDQLQVVIDDGLHFIEKCAEEKMNFAAVLFDVDSKDLTLGMSCPPANFLTKDVLTNVLKLIDGINGGIFVLNLVCRNDVLRNQVIEDLEGIFPVVETHKLDELLNEIVYCSSNELFKASHHNWKDILVSAANDLDVAIKTNITDNQEMVDMMELLNNLKF